MNLHLRFTKTRSRGRKTPVASHVYSCSLQLYDLHIGRVGEHHAAGDGCAREDAVCGANDVDGFKCGVNGTCVGSFREGEFRCECNPGSRGHRCETREYSFISFMCRSIRPNNVSVFSLVGKSYQSEVTLKMCAKRKLGVFTPFATSCQAHFGTIHVVRTNKIFPVRSQTNLTSVGVIAVHPDSLQ